VNKLSEWITISALIIAALVVIGLILALLVYKKKKEGKLGEPNYQVFFIIGIAWIPIGIVFMITVNSVIGIAFMGMGISYIAIGLANKDKWKKGE
jgi:tellurite resistance protein TehA-like permease